MKNFWDGFVKKASIASSIAGVAQSAAKMVPKSVKRYHQANPGHLMTGAGSALGAAHGALEKDPNTGERAGLKGALRGAVTGGVVGHIGSGFGSAAPKTLASAKALRAQKASDRFVRNIHKPV